ncbi:MAG: M64 family metallo-endopeptidase [Candidatus Aminicenantes bacterium]|nr:M64 family metallo-endopeptidase [Candidatus Aminicenantes bacterium]
MKIRILLALIAGWPLLASAQGTIDFSAYFVDQTMRVDVFHTGDAKEEMFAIDRIIQEGPWAGNPRRLIAPFAFGRYLLRVSDLASGELIYSKGFDSYFGEYKTTEPGVKGVKKTFSESLLIPFPKEKVRLEVLLRDRQNQPQLLFKTEIDPTDMFIVREKPASDVKMDNIVKNGPPASKVDLVILAEGYTEGQWQKFQKDLDHFCATILSQEPYKTYQDRFNITGVFKASAESGCDEPSYGTFKNTALGASFDSFGSERYLLTDDNRAMRDMAAHVPYDAILIMVNHPRYGGGGIYNLFCVFTSDDQWRDYLVMHEFGHSFSGLADEYYTSAVAYNEFYPPGVEPLEANITALLDAKNIKWKELVTKKTAVPTPWEKAAFEAMDMAYQKKRQETNERIAALKRANAPKEEIDSLQAKSDEMSRLNGLEVNAFFKKSRFQGKVGAFEGAGYAAKGLFRPMLDCLMFSRGLRPLCKVCERAVVDTIRYYSE